MIAYLARRLLYMIPTLILISMMTFAIIQLPPGDFLSSVAARPAGAQGGRSTPRRSRRCASATVSISRSMSNTGNGSPASCCAAISASRSSGTGRSAT